MLASSNTCRDVVYGIHPKGLALPSCPVAFNSIDLCVHVLRMSMMPCKVELAALAESAGEFGQERLRRRRRKFTTSIQPAKAYEDESVIMSGPH